MIRTYNGHNPHIPETCYVDASAQVIGDVILGEQASIWMNAVVRGDVHSIRIGARSNVQDCAVLHGMRHLYPVHVGEGVSIGHNATVHGCVIEDNCLIIAAGAVIPEGLAIPPRSLVAGVPGKIRRQVLESDYELIKMYARNYLDYSAQYKVEMA
jgi:carbonic anhydrase/acetyltransferase-like protein (isoleucine patch superfamily)